MKKLFETFFSGPPRYKVAVAVVLSFVVGFGIRSLGSLTHGDPLETAPPAQRLAGKPHVHPGEKNGVRSFLCPMMCIPPREASGLCPVCGMELVPASSMEATGSGTSLKLSPEAVALAELQTAPVERKHVSARIRLYGKIEYDPAHVNYVTAFMPGVIDRVYVKRPGQFVRWGAPLFSIYSSDLYYTQQQLVEAMRFVPSFLAWQEGQPYIARDAMVQERKGKEDPQHRSPEVEKAMQTVEAVRHKLTILGMPKRDIDELMKVGEPNGIATVYAPMYGQVVEVNATEGSYVNTGTSLFTLADPKYVWARLDAYEVDFPWIRLGQKVSFQVDAYPGETFEGDIVNINPAFKTKTRTFEIGVILPDTGGRLKSGMLVRSIVHAEVTAEGRVAGDEPHRPENAPLVIPASAPLITGKRAVAYVAVPGEPGAFEGREILLGPKTRDHYVVLDGLEEGEQVVVNGSFKVDSAVQILARTSMMSLEGGHTALNYQPSGGSQALHDEYWSQRTKSRLRTGAESETSLQDLKAAGEGSDVGHGEGRHPSRAKIQRRRPGTYGDTTQPTPAPRSPW